MYSNMFMRKPKKEHKHTPCSCQMERKKKTEKKMKPLEKITTINNIRIV